uniref:Root meristem growth factor 6 n=1 Tax=Noccaea caerulescens TaxID=107243 RepID=A0A1J3GLU5_NOCCA
MSCSVRCRLVMVFCFILLLLSSNVGCASTARRLGLHKHRHHHKAASSLLKVVNGGGRRRVLGGVETGEEVVVMDYPQPHRKPPIHNEKA